MAEPMTDEDWFAVHPWANRTWAVGNGTTWFAVGIEERDRAEEISRVAIEEPWNLTAFYLYGTKPNNGWPKGEDA